MKLEPWELFDLRMRREGKPKSTQFETKLYRDPSNLKMPERDCMQGTKEIENILRYELDNWLRWGRKKDWLPTSFRCPLGFLYASRYPIDSEARIAEMKVDVLEAAQLEKLIVALPQRHREAFIMHHLEKCAVNGTVRIIKGRNMAAQILGVQVRQYHYMVNQAHAMLLREAIKINPAISDDD